MPRPSQPRRREKRESLLIKRSIEVIKDIIVKRNPDKFVSFLM